MRIKLKNLIKSETINPKTIFEMNEEDLYKNFIGNNVENQRTTKASEQKFSDLHWFL